MYIRFIYNKNKTKFIYNIHTIHIQLNYRYGTQSLSLKQYIQPIVLLLSDPTSTVRDAAIQTLVEVYKHVGKFY